MERRSLRILKGFCTYTHRTQPTKWRIFFVKIVMNVHFLSRQNFSRQSFFRVSYTCSSNYSVYDEVYTHSPVARTFFCCTVFVCAQPHIFMRVTYTHGSSAWKGSLHMCRFLSISPSPFSWFTYPCCSCTVTSKPIPTTTSLTPTSTWSCRTFPTWKRRSSALRPRMSCLATWPSSFLTQVMSPRSSTRSLLWILTRYSSMIRTTISPTSRKPTNENTGQFGVPTVFESSLLHVSHGWCCSSERKQRKHAIGKPLLDREKEEREGFLWSVLQSRSQWKIDGTVSGVILFRLTKNSILIIEIFEDTCNEELNKLLLVKIQFRENHTRLSTTWRSRIWNEEIQNTHYLTHSVSWNLKDYNYWKKFIGQRSWNYEHIFAANWRWRTILIKNATQEVAENLTNWEDAAIKRKYIKKKNGRLEKSHAAWSGITNSESIEDSKSSMILTQRAVMTYLRSSSCSHYLEFEKAEPRSWNAAKYTREYEYSLETFLIVHMLNDILMNCTIILGIWRHFGYSENRRNWENWERGTIAITTFTLFFSKSEENTSWRQTSVMSMTNHALGIWTCTQVAWQFRVISTRRCICNSLTE